MFIVVAIVIFGIFVSLSYTLFGKTLQPAVVNLFTEATEQAEKDLKPELEVSVPKVKNWVTNIGTQISEDNDVLHKGNSTLKGHFNAIGDIHSIRNTLIYKIPNADLDESSIGGKVTVSFYAKSNKNIGLTHRLGGIILDYTPKTINLTKDWQYFEHTFTINDYGKSEVSPSIVSWISEEGTVWMSEYNVVINKGAK